MRHRRRAPCLTDARARPKTQVRVQAPARSQDESAQGGQSETAHLASAASQRT